MNNLAKEILKEYVSIEIEDNDTQFELNDTERLLEMLDNSTLGDILADLKSTAKAQKKL